MLGLEDAHGKTTIFVGCLIAAVFIACSIWVYFNYVRPRIDKSFVANKEFIDGDQPENATVFFFGTEWCPHCKSAMKPWNEFKSAIGEEGGSVNGVKIVFQEVDCDKEQQLASQYGIKGYPTVKYVRGKQIVEFDSKPTVPTLKQFVNHLTADK